MRINLNDVRHLMFCGFVLASVVLTTLGLSACTAPAPGRNVETVPPGMVYAGSYINVSAPNSEGWHLQESSGRTMTFFRRGDAPNESFVAYVVWFDLPQTKSPKEFETLIVQRASHDLATSRFSTTEFSHQYSDERGYPCVQAHNVSEDRQARTEPNKTETLVLENENLYCRHPVRANTGFVITYSHRGSSLYPNFQREAQAFIEGVQVPDSQPAPPAP